MSGTIGKRTRATLALSIAVAVIGAGSADAAESSRVLVFSKTTAYTGMGHTSESYAEPLFRARFDCP